MTRDRGDVLRPVATFALSGLAVLLLVGVAGYLALRSLSTSEAVRDARRVTTIAGRGIVEPELTTGVVRGDPHAVAHLDRIVRRRVMNASVARVKVWNAEGKILYADLPGLIGRRFPLGPRELQVLRSERSATEPVDSAKPENASERGLGHLTSVYLGLRAQDGTPVLFEEYLRSSAIAGSSRSVARLFAPIGVGALLALAALQIPLAWRLACRVRDARRDREVFLEHAVAASDRERRAIAAGLHDGVVQELAGHSFQMAAAVERRPPEAELRRILADSAAGTRNAIRQLRSLLLEIHPPALRDQGLAAALPDAAAPLSARGVAVAVEVDDALDVPVEVEQLVFRTAQEAIRNVGTHAAAAHVAIGVRRVDGLIRLRVADDGRGFDADEMARRRAEGHLGLALLRDLAEGRGGALRIDSAPGRGTTLELEVPVR